MFAGRLIRYLVESGLLPQLQFGFQKGKSTANAIIAALKYIAENIKNDEKVAAAFDCVNHEILLTKLCKYGVDVEDRALEWIASFLTGRSQYVSLSHSNT